MKRVFILSNQVTEYSGCHYYRAELPAKYLNRDKEWEVTITDAIPVAHARDEQGRKIIGLDEARLEKYDVFVFQRYYKDSPGIFVGLVQWAKENGKKVVYEFDDLMIAIPEHNPVAAVVNNKFMQKLIHFFLAESDLMTVASPALQQKFRAELLPNSIDFELWDEAYKIKGRQWEKPCVIYAGGASHKYDLELIKPVLKKFNDEIQLVFMGIDPEWDDVDYAFYQFTKTKRYPFLMKKLSPDIAIAPLEDTEFNRHKSNLKWLEYSALRIPTIASDVRPYFTINHETTGYLCKNLDDWGKYLRLMLDDVKLRKRIGQQAYNFTRKRFSMEDNIDEWKKAYS